MGLAQLIFRPPYAFSFLVSADPTPLPALFRGPWGPQGVQTQASIHPSPTLCALSQNFPGRNCRKTGLVWASLSSQASQEATEITQTAWSCGESQ